MKTKRIEVGDFVYCRSLYHRSKLGIPTEAGLVLEVKRSNYRLLYGADKFYWLPEETLAKIDGEVNTRTLAGRIHWLIKRMSALDCELVPGEGFQRATFRVDRIDHRMVDEMRELMGDDFQGLTLIPEGMAFMLAEIRIRNAG